MLLCQQKSNLTYTIQLELKGLTYFVVSAAFHVGLRPKGFASSPELT